VPDRQILSNWQVLFSLLNFYRLNSLGNIRIDSVNWINKFSFLGLQLQQHCFFAHSYKTTRLTVNSSHSLAASPANDVWRQQPHAEKRINYRNLKWTFQDSLPCNCYATKRNSGTKRSQVSQRESAGEGVDMRDILQAPHCITQEEWSWPLCSVSAIPVNKVLFQELKSINRDADFKFSDIFWLLVPISRGQIPVFPLCGHPWK